MKIIVLLRRDAEDFKGEMISAHNRTKELIKNFPDAEIKVFVLREYFNRFFCKLRGVPHIQRKSHFEYDGIEYNALWFNFSACDNILCKFKKQPYFLYKRLNRFVNYLKGADLVISHSTTAGYVAMKAKEKYGIPYTITWHGSDIHTTPFSNSFTRNLTISLIENASANCFVSKDLLNKSEKLTNKSNKFVLYNGVNLTRFKPFNNIQKNNAKKKYAISSDAKHVAYIGNLYHIKNVLALPEIYKRVMAKFSLCSVVFHFIGDGELRDELYNRCKDSGIKYRLWGNQLPENMPEIINCMDLVVLPSLNEGLPLVSVETLACGVPMVGANVGGISEVVGSENVVNHGEPFLEKMSDLIVGRLCHPTQVCVGDEFSWQKTGKIEEEIIKSLICN